MLWTQQDSQKEMMLQRGNPMLEDLPHPLQQVHGALSSVGGEYFVIQAASTACWLPALVYARGYGQIPTQMWHSGPMGTLEIHCVLPAQVCHTTP